MMSVVITVISVPIILFLLTRAMGLYRLMRLEMVNPSLSRVDADSDDAAATFANVHAWLLEQDFQLAAPLQMSPNFVSAVSRPRAARYYLSADQLVIALPTANHLHENGRPYSLIFVSRDASGKTLVTTNRSMEASFPLGPHCPQQDGYTNSDEAQYRLHREALAGFDAQPCHDIDEALAHSRENTRVTLDFWQQSGWIHGGTSSFRLTFKGAWALLRRLSRHTRHLRTLPAMQPQGDNTPLPVNQENFIRDVLALTQPGNTGGRWQKGLFFLATLGLFLALGKFQWGLATVLILLLVLFLHELGHFLAMRACGYRDVSIFFLPLLGAATSGRHDNASSRQKLIVLLAGPVPGILLGLGLLAVSMDWMPAIPFEQRPLLFTFITMLLVINYLNLLPVTPFDGGRVTEILFFSRFPRAHFFFFALCAAALGLAWFYTRDHVPLFIALVLLLVLPEQWRLARAARVLRPEFGRHPQQDDAIRALATAFTHSDLKSLPSNRRSQLVQPLLARLQQEVTPWRVTLAGSALYAALLALPLVLLLPSMSASLMLPGLGSLASHRAADQYRKELERDAEAAKTPLQKMAIYSELASYLQYSDKEAAYGYANQAIARITPDLDDAPEAADARLALADILDLRGEKEKARALYIEAYEKLQQAHPEEYDRLGQLLQKQSDMLDDPMSLAEKTRLAEQAYQYFAKSEYPDNRLMQGSDMALLLHRQDRDKEAEALLRQLLTEAENPDSSYWQKEIHNALAWLLLDTHRAADGVLLLQGIADSKEAYDSTPRALAWAQLLAGRADAARQTLHAALEAREKGAGEDYERMQLAFYQVDEVLTWRAGTDTDAAEKSRQRLQAFLVKNKVDGNALARQASYELGEWSQSLAKAELALLEEMGYSSASQCKPGNDDSAEKEGKATPSTST